MNNVQPLCPNCGSENLRAVDRVLVTNPVSGWEFDLDGKLKPTVFDEGEVWWDSSEFVEYDCAACGYTIPPEKISSVPRKGESNSVPRWIPNEPIERVKLYNERMNELEIAPNGDDYNNILNMLNGGPYEDPSRLAR